MGYIMAPMPVWQRAITIVGGLAMLYPGTTTDIIGIVLVGGVIAMQFFSRKKIPASPAS